MRSRELVPHRPPFTALCWNFPAMTSFLSDLRARGLIDQASNEEALERLLNTPGASIYI